MVLYQVHWDTMQQRLEYHKISSVISPLGYLKKKEGKEGINSEVSQQETTIHSLSGNQATVLWNFS